METTKEDKRIYGKEAGAFVFFDQNAVEFCQSLVTLFDFIILLCKFFVNIAQSIGFTTFALYFTLSVVVDILLGIK